MSRLDLHDVPLIKPHDRLTARRMNESRNTLNALLQGIRSGIFEDDIETPITIRRLRVEIVAGDYLECKMLSAAGGDVGVGRLAVAKPWELRRTPFDGLSWDGYSYSYSSHVERVSTKDSDETTETQVVVPRYVFGGTGAGSIIFAVKGITALPGVQFGDPAIVVTWQDMNVSGRAWAKKHGT